MRAEQPEVRCDTRFAECDLEVQRNADHCRCDDIMEGAAGARTAIRVGERRRAQELAGEELVPMEFAFPVICATRINSILSGVIGAAPVTLEVQNVEEPCTA